MKRIHPLTCLTPTVPLPVRRGGATGMVGAFGWTRRNPDGSPKIHKGIDLLANPGQPVFAAHDGRVARAGEQHLGEGYGQRLYLASDEGVETRYAHLSVEFVKQGDIIRAGHCLGLVGRSGNITRAMETHLHFEVYEGGDAVNPIWWLHGEGDRLGVPKESRMA